jgi:hypothetical protein
MQRELPRMDLLMLREMPARRDVHMHREIRVHREFHEVDDGPRRRPAPLDLHRRHLQEIRQRAVDAQIARHRSAQFQPPVPLREYSEDGRDVDDEYAEDVYDRDVPEVDVDSEDSEVEIGDDEFFEESLRYEEPDMGPVVVHRAMHAHNPVHRVMHVHNPAHIRPHGHRVYPHHNHLPHFYEGPRDQLPPPNLRHIDIDLRAPPMPAPHDHTRFGDRRF